MRSSRTRCRTPTRCTRCRSSRAGGRSATRSRCRSKTSSSSRAASSPTSSRCCSVGRTAEELIFADPHDRRAERHRACHHGRAADGHRVRDERRARPDAVRPHARRGVPRSRLPSTPDYSDERRVAYRRRGPSGSSSRHTTSRATILETNRAVLDRLAADLMEHETLEAEQVHAIFEPVKPHASDLDADGAGRPSAVASSDIPPARRPPR